MINQAYSIKWDFSKSCISKIESFFWLGSHDRISITPGILAQNIMRIQEMEEKVGVADLIFSEFWHKPKNKQKMAIFGFKSKIVTRQTNLWQKCGMIFDILVISNKFWNFEADPRRSENCVFARITRAAALFFRRRSTVDSYLRRLKKPPKFAEIAAENSRDFNPNDFGGNEGQGRCMLKAWIFYFFQ